MSQFVRPHNGIFSMKKVFLRVPDPAFDSAVAKQTTKTHFQSQTWQDKEKVSVLKFMSLRLRRSYGRLVDRKLLKTRK